MNNMKAQPLIRDRIEYADDAVAHVTVWKVPRPIRGSQHDYKYRLAYVVNGKCVLRYDNEAGKGDHRHWDDDENPYVFMNLSQLLADFTSDIARWNDENSMV